MRRPAKVRTSLVLFLATSVSIFVCHRSLVADLIYESATTLYEGDAGNSIGGTTTSTTFYSGVFFELDDTVLVNRYGGHFGQSGTNGNRMIFAAIVSVDNFGDLPDLDNNALDVGLIELPANGTTANVHTSTLVLLQPGIFALVFGNGRFGAGDDTSAAKTNEFGPVNEGINITFAWRQSDDAIINQSPGARYFVEGIYVPEPSMVFICGLISMLFCRRKRN